MLDGYEGQRGAPDNRDDRLKGELLATLSELKDRYQTSHLELAYTVMQSLLQHVERYEGLAALVEFSDKTGEMLTNDAKDICAILDEDFKAKLN
ncbi:MAG: hypothetical protein OIF58_05115 [Cohaesibacter sp.]|nr:hypothetical protein [Cohaesibacter sp.]